MLIFFHGFQLATNKEGRFLPYSVILFGLFYKQISPYSQSKNFPKICDIFLPNLRRKPLYYANEFKR